MIVDAGDRVRAIAERTRGQGPSPCSQSGDRIVFISSQLFWIVEMHRLQFSKNGADVHLCLDAKYESFGIVGHPDCGATKLPVRFQFEILADAFQGEIELDRIVASCTRGDLFSPEYGDSGEVGICRRVNYQAINAPLFKRLTPQVKRRRVQIEQVRENKLLCLCFGSAALTFCSCSSHSAVRESEMGNDSL